ncbi:MAG: sugar phosphate isomerase/epimerase [Eubacteriales bacterium]|nr:sugar phosphate isomerase/epimerase [Eubacteriales bacterium]
MKIGIQLYSCRDKIMDKDGLCKTLETLAGMGYAGVEFVSQGAYGVMDPEKLRKQLAACGLEAIGVHMHLPLQRWLADDLEDVLNYARKAGLHTFTLPWLAEEDRTVQNFERIIQKIPDWIRLCRRYGMEFLWHNHDFEMAAYGEGILLEAIADAAPGMKIELDTFWTHFTGKDPCGMMDDLGDRLGLVHVKDYHTLAPFYEMKFDAVGTGIMDNASVIRKAVRMNQEWIIVEQDNSPVDTLESARISIEGVRRLMEQGVQ